MYKSRQKVLNISQKKTENEDIFFTIFILVPLDIIALSSRILKTCKLITKEGGNQVL